ncbi:MAG: 30S ribosomal protein S11 [Patescibacteria group bacterium]
MGKKKIIVQNQEELIKEREKVDTKLQKEVKIEPRQRTTEGQIYIFSSYNNTIINVTDAKGNVLTWASAGAIGFKGAKKATPFAASKVAETIAERTKKMGIEKVKIFVKGIGSGRESAIRSLAARGLEIDSIKDITPIPHNGCKPKKPRRV